MKKDDLLFYYRKLIFLMSSCMKEKVAIFKNEIISKGYYVVICP